jgi:hypothetical protein
MRKTLFAGTIIALAAIAPLAAQDPGAGMASMNGSWIASLGGGVTLPVGDASDIFKTGWHGNATIGYRPAGSKLSYVLDAGYHRAENKFLPGVDETDEVEGAGNSNIFTAFARINYELSPMLYFLGGVGVLRREFPVEGSNAIFTNTDAGVAATVGLGVVIGKLLFVEGRVINKFSDPSLMIVPVTIGVRF